MPTAALGRGSGQTLPSLSLAPLTSYLGLIDTKRQCALAERKAKTWVPVMALGH